MITGLPPYREPIDQTLRCICSKLYLVTFTGDGKKMAARIGAELIDARAIPFLNCASCGQLLTLVEEAAAMVM